MQTISTRSIAGLGAGVLACAAVALALPAVRAADAIWSNTGTDFNTPGNWSAGVPGAGDRAIFSGPAGTLTQPNLSASTTITNLQFGSAINSSGYGLSSSNSGVTLSLTSTATTAGDEAIAAQNTSGTNIISAPVVLGAAANGTQTFSVASGGTLTVSGVISELNSGLQLRKADGGTLRLSGVNSYTGGTTIRQGTLVWNDDKALGDGSVTLKDSSSAGSASLLGTSGRTLDNPIAVSGDGAGTATIGQSATTGATQYNGTIAINRSTTFANGGGSGTLVLLKEVSGTGGATFSGGGTTVIAANNSYSGGTTISGGVVNVGNSGSTGTIPGNVTNDSSMRFNRTDAYTFSGAISGVGNVRSINSGTVTLTAANTYGGGTIIEEGRIIANNTSGSATGSNSVTINSDGTLSGTGSVAGAVQVNGAGRLSAGDPLVSGNRIESLAIGSGLSFVGASHFDYEIQSNAALNVAADAVVVSGNLSISSTAALNLTDLAGMSASILGNGVKLTLISYSGTWNGTTFDSRPNGSLVTLGPNQFTLSYNDSARGLNFTTDIANGLKYVTLTSIAAVPEASVVVFGVLLCLAIGGVAAARKRLGHLDAADASAQTSCGRSPTIFTARTRVLPKLRFSRFFDFRRNLQRDWANILDDRSRGWGRDKSSGRGGGEKDSSCAGNGRGGIVGL